MARPSVCAPEVVHGAVEKSPVLIVDKRHARPRGVRKHRLHTAPVVSDPTTANHPTQYVKYESSFVIPQREITRRSTLNTNLLS